MAKRALRSNTVLDTAPELPPSKKRKTAGGIKYLCYSCDEERAPFSFPDYLPSPECENHLINTCKKCLKSWAEIQIESGSFAAGEDNKVFGIQCPQCPAIMRSVNVQMAAAKKVYLNMFEVRERHHIAEITPGWRWCMSATCKAGQVHEKKPNIASTANEGIAGPHAKGKAKAKAKKKQEIQQEQLQITEPVVDICICNECGAKACVTCDRPYHDGENCQEYQARIKDKTDEEDKSLRAIQRLARGCPSCHKPIQKNGGCPNMFCTACQTAFCWTCMEALNRGPCKCYAAIRMG